MNQNEAPAGTLAVIGHPANDIRIVKVGEHWRYVHSGDLVNPEDFRAGWDTIDGLADVEAEAEKALTAFAVLSGYTPNRDESDSYKIGFADGWRERALAHWARRA